MKNTLRTEKECYLNLLTKDEIIDITFQMLNDDYYNFVNQNHDAADSSEKLNTQRIFNNTPRYSVGYQRCILKMSSKYLSATSTCTYNALVYDDMMWKGACTEEHGHQFIEA